MSDWCATNTATTAEAPQVLGLTIRRDEDGRYLVRDWVGLRYGHSTNPLMALIAWWWQVQDLLDMDEPTAPPLSSEIANYRKSLGDTA